MGLSFWRRGGWGKLLQESDISTESWMSKEAINRQRKQQSKYKAWRWKYIWYVSGMARTSECWSPVMGGHRGDQVQEVGQGARSHSAFHGGLAEGLDFCPLSVMGSQ